jgi:hypothetical protein
MILKSKVKVTVTLNKITADYYPIGVLGAYMFYKLLLLIGNL